jgi:hypothetical protein
MNLIFRTAASLVVLGLLALATATGAVAEPPRILVLPGEKISELKFEGKSETGGKLETVGGKAATCTKGRATSTATPLPEKESDSEAGEATIDLEGCKKEKVACRSETSGGLKDPVETILIVLAMSGASEETTEKVLAAEFVATAKETLIVNCGGVKELGKGSGACLVSPALTELAAGATGTLSCRQEKGKQITGNCVETKATCEKLEKEPFLVNLGAGFESAALEFEGVGSFTKMIFGDD